MVERLVFMQVEDNMVTFEREDGSTIIHPAYLIPSEYKEGDIIKSIIYCEGFIEFLNLDFVETKRRHDKIAAKKSRLKNRAKRSTNA